MQRDLEGSTRSWAGDEASDDGAIDGSIKMHILCDVVTDSVSPLIAKWRGINSTHLDHL